MPQVMELNTRLAEKNNRLHEENDVLHQRLSGSQDAGRAKSTGLLGGIRSLGRRTSRYKAVSAKRIVVFNLFLITSSMIVSCRHFVDRLQRWLACLSTLLMA